MSDTVSPLVAEVLGLPWVVSVYETDRDDATHRIVTNLSVVRVDHEIHTLDNIGVQTEAYSQIGAYGVRILATIP